MQPRPSRSGLLFRSTSSLALIIFAILVFMYRQQLYDEYMERTYQPTSAISEVTTRAKLSNKGTFLFYASRPQLLERDAFNGACRSAANEQSAVLGCYLANRIYLFHIDNQQLDGVEEVTAAHEMLHAAYQRLSTSERNRVNALLETQAKNLGADQQRIDALMAEYDKAEPGERLNELHSILGSEVGNLSPELEAYYSQYFTNRSDLVTLAASYQSVFDGLKTKQETLVSQINSLADSIEQQSDVYKRNSQVLDHDIKDFNARASSGSMSEAQYESERAGLEIRQKQLQADYDTIQGMISDYKEKRSELSAINSESDALNRSINSSLAPVPGGI